MTIHPSSRGWTRSSGAIFAELLQLDFRVAQDLRPSHCLLDIACGALRGGVHVIHYLERPQLSRFRRA
jgi:hypothetical protein